MSVHVMQMGPARLNPRGPRAAFAPCAKIRRLAIVVHLNFITRRYDSFFWVHDFSSCLMKPLPLYCYAYDLKTSLADDDGCDLSR
jgi:hypothetical protein